MAKTATASADALLAALNDLRGELGGRGLVTLREYFGGWTASVRHSMAEDSWITSNGQGETLAEAIATLIKAFIAEWCMDLSDDAIRKGRAALEEATK